jgi:site-specific recombinase XerD
MSSALATIDAPTLPAVIIEAELDAARTFALAEKSPATRRAYRSDFAGFTAWCGARGLVALPASADTVAAWLAALATGGAKASTIGRKAAAIRYAHKLAGHEPPTGLEAVKAVMRGIRREIGTAAAQKSPATADRIADIVRAIPDTLIGKRDRALLLLGFAGAFRRSELVALTVADLIDAEGGLRVVIRHSKTDQEGQGQEIAIPHGSRLRPVEAVRAWLAAAGITDGPVFRPIAKGGRVAAMALSGRSVAEIVKHHAERAGLDPAAYAGHSLRSGFITTGAENGASVFKLMEVSRHKSVDTLRGYVRRADLFRDHAGASFL